MTKKKFEETISEYLFKTEALKVSPADNPFIYTSGKLGPFYINTHFLYGQKEAKDLLEFINEKLSTDRSTLPKDILSKTKNRYETDSIYKNIVERLVSEIMLNIDLNKIDYISGGERRDWFFSIIIANILNKPHISIFKDKSVIITNNESVLSEKIDFENKKILHICDLVTEASSFKNIWHPVINKSNNMVCAASVVDRNQGGTEYFENTNTKFIKLIKIDMQFFLNALSKNYIDINQYVLIDKYTKNPQNTIKDILLNNPDFIKNIKNSKNVKSKKRIKAMLENNYYNLPEKLAKKYLKNL